jgi:NAD(P)H dehydrogenase (quinone)
MPSTHVVRNALIVVAHPNLKSLSHSLAHRISSDLSARGITVEIADLHQGAFSATMSAADIEHYRGNGKVPSDVAAEQARIDGADMLVIVFPVYWWSVPALLKGWFERVFTGGWAYKIDEQGRLTGSMRNIPVRLIATGAGDKSGYDRHGYTQAIQTQVIEGVFGFCGMKDTQIAMFYEADETNVDHIDRFVNALSLCDSLLVTSTTKPITERAAG